MSRWNIEDRTSSIVHVIGAAAYIPHYITVYIDYILRIGVTIVSLYWYSIRVCTGGVGIIISIGVIGGVIMTELYVISPTSIVGIGVIIIGCEVRIISLIIIL